MLFFANRYSHPILCIDVNPLSHNVPIGRRIQYEEGKYAYKCDRCDEWVRVCANNMGAATSTMRTHQDSRKCREIAACIDNSYNERAYSHRSATTSCPGVALAWPSATFFSSYLWHLHDNSSSYRLPWMISSYDEDTSTFYIRAQSCIRSANEDGSSCPACSVLRTAQGFSPQAVQLIRSREGGT
jgi:hypothetical protein